MAGPGDTFALGEGTDACLLLHGLTGSPAEMRPVGEALAAAGFRALGPLLPGHGTRPEDLASVTRADLLRAAEEALLSLRGARRLFLCGLSVGGLLAIHLAARSFASEGLPEFAAVALLAPAIQFAGGSWFFANVLGFLPPLPFILSKGGRDLAVAGPEAKAAASYEAIPLKWAGELRALSRAAAELAPRVRAPALLLHGALDRTVSPASTRRLSRTLGSSRIEVVLLPRSGHVLPLDAESQDVCRAVVSFFQGVA
ncbi:MAG TPA: alpha/beta fold hydrolase [Myxococcales bacterium]|nr:alpha/beta fold hydrolase [Myxococcales bacterium]